MKIGEEIYSWIKDLYPIKRTLAGPGFNDTLSYIKKIIPEVKINNFPSGSKVFDWTVPDEWHLRKAYIKDPDGNIVLDSGDSSLFVVGYSKKINKKLPLNELKKNIYTLKDLPDAVPYVTSFYDSNWGFCMSYNQFINLKDGLYEIFIDSEFIKGNLKTGEYTKKGKSKKQIIFSTYLCHPEMVNNELAAPTILVALARELEKKNTKYTYKFLFNVETIGTLCYIQKHLQSLKENVAAGFVITCFGDAAKPNLVPSKYGDTLADSFAKKTLSEFRNGYNHRSYFDKGSEERQYTHPNVDLPFVTITRSLFREFEEYHTSSDNLSMVTNDSLTDSFNILSDLVDLIEAEPIYISTTTGEPFLTKRKLYAKISSITKSNELHNELSTKLVNLNSYCDGKNLISDLATLLPYSTEEIKELIDISIQNNLIKEITVD